MSSTSGSRKMEAPEPAREESMDSGKPTPEKPSKVSHLVTVLVVAPNVNCNSDDTSSLLRCARSKGPTDCHTTWRPRGRRVPAVSQSVDERPLAGRAITRRRPADYNVVNLVMTSICIATTLWRRLVGYFDICITNDVHGILLGVICHLFTDPRFNGHIATLFK